MAALRRWRCAPATDASSTGSHSAAPVIASGERFFGQGEGSTDALRTSDGGVIWRFQSRDVIASTAPPVGSTLAALLGRTLSGLEAATGDALWQQAVGIGATNKFAGLSDVLYLGAGHSLVAVRGSDGARPSQVPVHLC